MDTCQGLCGCFGHFVGLSKSIIIQELDKQNDEYVEFLRWLFIPKNQLVLSFDRHICQKANFY